MNDIRNHRTLQFSIAVAVLLFSAVAFGSVQPHLRLFGSIIVFTILVSLSMMKNSRIEISVLIVPVAIFLLYGLASISFSLHKVPALEKMLVGLQAFIVLLLIHRTQQTGWSKNVWENAIISLAFVFSVIEILLYGLWLAQKSQYFQIDPAGAFIGYRASGTLLGHPNVFAGFLNIAILLGIHRLINEKEPKQRSLWLVPILIFFYVNYLTSSRSGWVALAAGIGIYVLLYALSNYKAIRHWYYEKSLTLRVIIASSVLTVLVIGILAFGWLIVIQQEISTGHAPILSSRQGLWRPALDVFIRSPVFGSGSGNFTFHFADETNAPPGFITSHAHNIFLQIGAEYGILGILILVAGIGIFLRELAVSWRIRSDQDFKNFGLLAAIFSIFLVHHLADYLLESPLYLITILYVLILSERLTNRWTIQLGRSHVSALLLLLALLVAVTSWISLQSAFTFWDGVTLFRDGEKLEGTSKICEAAKQQEQRSYYHAQCGLATIHSTILPPDDELLKAVERSFLESVRIEPAWPMHIANLGMIQWELGKHTDAINTLEGASASAPRNALLALNLGRMYEEEDRKIDARQSYQAVLLRNPWLAETHFFNSNEFRRDVSASIKFRETLTGYTYEIWLGRQAIQEEAFALAREHFNKALNIDEFNSGPYTGLAEVDLSEGDLKTALIYIDRALFIDRGWPSYRMLDLKAQILLEAGDAEQADQLMRDVFESILNDSSSEMYYARAYNQYYIPPDKVPFLQRAILTDGMASRLNDFAESIQLDDPLLANQIRSLIDREIE